MNTFATLYGFPDFKKLAFLLVLFWINFHFSYSQKITGVVYEEGTKKPLEQVNIYLKNHLKKGTHTDVEGVFSLQLTDSHQATDSIYFSRVGFETHATTLSQLMKEAMVIYLPSKRTNLEEVVVRDRRLQNLLQFKKIANLENGIYSFASILNGNKIYISGGDESIQEDMFKKASLRAAPTATFEEIMSKMYPSTAYTSYSRDLLMYDLDSNTFKKVTDKLDPRGYHSMILYKDLLYILGGKKTTHKEKKEYLFNSIEIFNVKNEIRQQEYTYPHQAVNFSSFIYNDNLITLGGSIKQKEWGGKIFTDKIHALDLSNGYWYEIGKMKTPKETSAVLMDDKIYLVGGYNNTSLATIETWDLTTGEWETLGEMFYGLDAPALTANEDKIYIYHNNKMLVYHIKKKKLVEYKINLGVKKPNIHFYKDAIFIVGGYVENEYSTNPSAAVYKVELSQFDHTKKGRIKSF